MPVQTRSTATVDAIFEATIQILLREGADRLTTTRVAERAVVSVGTLYQYYPNEHSLLFAVIIERHLNHVMTAVERACVEHRHQPLGRMVDAVVQAFVDAKLERKDVSVALSGVSTESGAEVVVAKLGGEPPHTSGASGWVVLEQHSKGDSSSPLNKLQAAVRSFELFETFLSRVTGNPDLRDLVRIADNTPATEWATSVHWALHVNLTAHCPTSGFGIVNGMQFRSGPPPVLQGGAVRTRLRWIKLVGDVNSTVRPQDRTDVARFYIIPAIQVYNPAARQVSVAQGKTPAQNAQDFALLAMATCDGLISVMETKYFYNRWRPVTAIRSGDTDGNPNTDPDVARLPLIVTPPFPSYPSAHTSAGGAARRVLERLYGKDGFSVTLTIPTAPRVVLHYTAWKQITDDRL